MTTTIAEKLTEIRDRIAKLVSREPSKTDPDDAWLRGWNAAV